MWSSPAPSFKSLPISGFIYYMEAEATYRFIVRLARDKGWVYKTDKDHHALLMPGSRSFWNPLLLIQVGQRTVEFRITSHELDSVLSEETLAVDLLLPKNSEDELGMMTFHPRKAQFEYKLVLRLQRGKEEAAIRELFVDNLIVGCREFIKSADNIASSFSERTIPRHFPRNSLETGAETKRVNPKQLMEELYRCFKETNAAILLEETLTLTMNLEDGLKGMLREQGEIIDVVISATRLGRLQTRNVSLLSYRFPLLHYLAREDSIQARYNIHLSDFSLHEATQLVKCTLTLLQQEARAALQLASILDFNVPKFRPLTEFNGYLTYELQSEEEIPQYQLLLNALSQHFLSTALIFPERIVNKRLYFKIPANCIPLIAYLQQNQEIAESVLAEIQPLLSEYEFESSYISSFFSPSDQKVLLAVLNCRPRTRRVENMAGFVLGLVRGLEGGGNWVVPGEVADVLGYERVSVEVQELCREANWHCSLAHPYILSGPGITVLPDGQYCSLRPAGLTSLCDLLSIPHQPVEIFTILLRTAEAVLFLHSHGICHLALRPERIYLRDRKELMVGIAPPAGLLCWLSESEVRDRCAAPEIQARHSYSPSSDVYSFAQVINICWTLDSSLHRDTEANRTLYALLTRALTTSERPSLPSLAEALFAVVRAYEAY